MAIEQDSNTSHSALRTLADDVHPKSRARRKSADRPLAPVLHLVPKRVCRETTELLAEMLGEAMAGRVIGLAFVAVYEGRKYVVDTAGEAERNPTLTRGMVAALDDHLRDQVHGVVRD